MSNVDIKHAVDQSFCAFQQACQGFVRADWAANPFLPDPCSPIVLLTLVFGLACSLLGYITFLILVHQDDRAKAKAMQYEVKGDAETNGLHREDPVSPTKPSAAVDETSQQQSTALQPVEYEESAETSEQRTPPTQTATPPTPEPGTPSVVSQPPTKSASDSEDGPQPSKLASLKSVLSNVESSEPFFACGPNEDSVFP